MVIVDKEGSFKGIIETVELYAVSMSVELNEQVDALITKSYSTVSGDTTLRAAIAIMVGEHIDILPVLDENNESIIGLVSYKDIIRAYQYNLSSHEYFNRHISIKRSTIKILLHGKKLVAKIKPL